MSTGGLFSFNPAAGETPETLKRRRAIAEQLLANATGAPASTIGGGLAALGQAIGGRLALGRVDRATAAGQAGAAADFGKLYGGGGTPAVADALTGGGGSDTMAGSAGNDRYRSAIAGIESGGRYGIVGPRHKTLGRALGKYQIMEANVGPWSREALGREVSASEFLANPQIQDRIFDAKFGQYVAKYGPEGAARAWFGGPGNIKNTGAKDVFGTTVGGYGSRFMKSLGGDGGGKAAVADALAGGPGGDTLGYASPAIDAAAKDDFYQPAAASVPASGADPAALAAAGMIDPAAKDDVLPFRPAGGPTPYVEPDDLGTSDPAYRKMLEERPMSGITVPQTPGAVPLPSVAAPEAPPVAATAPADAGAAPVAQALGYDPLPQTSAMPGVGGVQGAGHESLSPGAQAVSQALGGGGGADALAGGGGFFDRLFGGRRPAPAAAPSTALAGGGGGVPSAAATGFSPQAQAAIAALQNPWLNEGQQAVAKAILSQELEQATPQARATLEKTLLEIQQSQHPELVPPTQAEAADIERGRAQTDIDRREYELAVERLKFDVTQGDRTTETKNYDAWAADERSAGREPKLDRLQYEKALSEARASKTSVTTVEDLETFKAKESIKASNLLYGKLAEDIGEAQSFQTSVYRLADLASTVEPGTEAGVANWVREMTGIQLNDDASDQQAFTTMINYLTPRMRVPGAGPSSNLDAAQFKLSLPQILGTKGGNALVMETLVGMANQRLEIAQIGQDVITQVITPEEGRNRMNSLPDPFAPLKDAGIIGPESEVAKQTTYPRPPLAATRELQSLSGAELEAAKKEYDALFGPGAAAKALGGK